MGDVTLRKFLWLAIAVVVVVALWTFGWFWAAGELRQQVQLLADGDGEAKPKITCGSFTVTGFPFRLDAECRDGQVIDGDLTVTATALRASLLVYNPTHVIFSAHAPIAYADAFTGSQRRLDFSGLEGSARLTSGDLLKGLSGEGWRIARVSVVADDVAWVDTVASDIVEARAAHIEAHLIDMPEQHDATAGTAGLAAYVNAKTLDLPALQVTGGELSLDAEATKLPDDLRALTSADAIRRWQAAGGTLKLVKLAGSQPQPDERFEITGDATLTPAGLVQGQVNYTTKGVLDRLAAFVPPLQLVALKGAPAVDGSFSNALSIDNGVIRLIGVPLLQLPPAF